MNIGHCDLCGFETLASRLRGGACRAVVGCKARRDEQHRATGLDVFLALPAETRMALAIAYDADFVAWHAAIVAGDYSVPEPRSLAARAKEVAA